jgi:spore coat protein CotF
MNQQISEAQFKNTNVEDEISLIDILLFLKSSTNNIAISIIGCLVFAPTFKMIWSER